MEMNSNKTTQLIDVEECYDIAMEILSKIGLKVPNEKIRKKISNYLKLEGEYAKFDKTLVEKFMEEIKQKFGKDKIRDEKRTEELKIYTSRWCHYYVDPQTLEIKPMTTDKLIEFTKLNCQLKDEGVLNWGLAGYPLDVPPPIQFITAYYIDCIYNKDPFPCCLAHSSDIMKYLIEIGKVMGHEIGVSVEPVSPLTFSGDSVNIAFDFLEEQIPVGVDVMPIMGITAPLDWKSAWAQSIAESLGSYIIFRISGFNKVYPSSFRLFPPNMRSGMIYFNSPKHIFALLMRREIRGFLGLETNWSEAMLVTSKMPDSQAAAEKMAGALLSFLNGFYDVEAAGALSLDEIYSPQQLIIDIEIVNYVKAVSFKPMNKFDSLELIKQGLEKGFLGTDHTLTHYKEFIWNSSIFDLNPKAKWLEKRKNILDSSYEVVTEKIKKYDYELEGGKRRELEKIYNKARNELCSKI